MTTPYVWLDPADAIFVSSCRDALKIERRAYEAADAERRALRAENAELRRKIAMTPEALSTTIRSIVTDHLMKAGKDTEITEESCLAHDLGLDSLDVWEIVFAVEEAFDVEFTDQAVTDLKTVGDLAGFVAGELGIGKAAA